MRCRIIITLTLSIILTTILSTQSDKKSESPYFLVTSEEKNNLTFPLQSTSVDVHIAGVIADVHIQQVYKNTGDTPIEAIYVFPASSNAAVYHMEMKIGNRIIKAEIKEKEAARQAFQEAKQVGKRTSLLEQYRPNIFTMNVANIQAGETNSRYYLYLNTIN